MAAQLTRLTSVEEVSAALCSQTQRVVAFDNARVYVLHEDGSTLEPVAFRPHAREYHGESAAGLRVTVGEGITGWVAATGQQLIIDDAARDPRAVQVPGSADLTEESMLLAPLRSEGRVIGVVVLSRLGLARFSDDELRLLGVLADQAAVAIENARLLARTRPARGRAGRAARHQPGRWRCRLTSAIWPMCSRASCGARRAWTPASSPAGTRKPASSCPSAPKAGR